MHFFLKPIVCEDFFRLAVLHIFIKYGLESQGKAAWISQVISLELAAGNIDCKITRNFKLSKTLYSCKIYRGRLPSYKFLSFAILYHEAWSEALTFCKSQSRRVKKWKESFGLRSSCFTEGKRLCVHACFTEAKRLRVHACLKSRN